MPYVRRRPSDITGGGGDYTIARRVLPCTRMERRTLVTMLRSRTSMKIFICVIFLSASSSAFAAERAVVTPATFVDQVAQNGMMEKALSELALRKSATPAVLEHANRTLARSEDAHARLSAIANARGIAPPLELDANGLALLQALDSEEGASFDYVYARRMNSGHSRTLELYQDAARSRDADVADFARAGMPAVKENKVRAKKLARQSR
jgi:putative membrane protein